MVDVEMVKNIVKDKAINYGKQKADEVLSDPEKFQDTLDKISKNNAFQKIKTIWDTCEESDKEKVYTAGQQMGKSGIERVIDPLGLGIIQTVKQTDPILATIQMLRYKNKSLKGLKAVCPPQTCETTMRFLVQLGLLDTPQKITPAIMLKDLKGDTKSIDIKLITFEAVATVVPYLRPLLPLIQSLKQYVKKLGEVSIQQVMIQNAIDGEIPKNKEEKKTETNEALLVSKIKEGLELKEVLDNKNTTQIKKDMNSEHTQQVRNENKGNATIGKDSNREFSKN